MPKGLFDTKSLKTASLAVQVSQVLTQAILEGKLKGGDHLLEAELQEQFGISRSPLREAFRDLEKKGLVVIVPRKGTFVREITRKDIEENFPVRASLEGLAAVMARSVMSSRELDGLKDILGKMEKAVEAGDLMAYFKHHLRFHEGFIEGSKNNLLIDVLTNLRLHSMWLRFSYKYYQEDLPKSLAVHQKIFELLSNPETDQEKLRFLVVSHIEAGMERFLEYLENN